MKKIQIFATLCVLFLLAGCTSPTAPTEPTIPPETTVPLSDTTPSGTDSALEGSTLPMPTGDDFHHEMVKPTVEGRCAATSLGQMVETENGYYFAANRKFIYYADKTDLTNWVMVCNQPNCSHNNIGMVCPARISGGIWGRDGKIYFLPDAALSTKAEVIMETPGDGSGITCAFSDENSPLNSEFDVMYSPQLYEGGLCMHVEEMQNDGFWDYFLYFVDETGAHKCTYAQDFPDVISAGSGNTANQARGDLTMNLITEFDQPEHLYRVNPECFEKLEFPEGCDYYGAYLSGDTMIHYHPNDGFYKLDYYAGTEEKIADAAYTDGYGLCMDGEFLVETTLSYHKNAKECKLRYFYGETWTEVPLPETFTPETNLRTVALTSDTLFLEDFDIGGALYMVKLGDNQMIKCMDTPVRN